MSYCSTYSCRLQIKARLNVPVKIHVAEDFQTVIGTNVKVLQADYRTTPSLKKPDP